MARDQPFLQPEDCDYEPSNISNYRPYNDNTSGRINNLTNALDLVGSKSGMPDAYDL